MFADFEEVGTLKRGDNDQFCSKNNFKNQKEWDTQVVRNLHKSSVGSLDDDDDEDGVSCRQWYRTKRCYCNVMHGVPALLYNTKSITQIKFQVHSSFQNR